MSLCSYTLVLEIISHLPDTDPLWKQTLESYVSHWTPDCDDYAPGCYLDAELEDGGRLLPGFMHEVLKEVALRTEPNPPGCSCCSNPCTYHEHESEEEWKATCGKVKGSKLPESLL
ncbi:hypothetical protein E4T42_01952 [Aureobasidium subglaciale]|nr:hypothetical protein E4T42_01952 [Aureobasidium subglaciale]